METIENISEIKQIEKKKTKSVGFHSVKWIVFVLFAVYAISLIIPFLNTYNKGKKYIGNEHIWKGIKEVEGYPIQSPKMILNTSIIIKIIANTQRIKSRFLALFSPLNL